MSIVDYNIIPSKLLTSEIKGNFLPNFKFNYHFDLNFDCESSNEEEGENQKSKLFQ